MNDVYFDYRFKFSVANLATALRAMAALRSFGLLGAGDLPENMLGDPRDDTGAVASTAITWIGRRGAAASSYTNPEDGKIVNVPARGDPASYYIHIRATVDPATLPFDPSTYGLMPSDPNESAAVLGVWA